jgi:bifunctional non-homologous end joining protein LigD
LRYSDHQQGDGEAFFKAATALNVEGIISKDSRSTYQSERTRDWLKIKRIERQEFVIVGFQKSNADRNAIGSLLLGEKAGKAFTYVGKVGTGYTASSAKTLYSQLTKIKREKPALAGVPREAQRNAVWVDPKLVAEIEFSAWTKDHILRHAAFIGLREDKRASEVRPEIVLPVAAVTSPKKEHKTKTAAPAATDRPFVRGIGISHPDRLIYPHDTRTKFDIARYYDAVAEVMLPYLRDRPLALVRCPDGVGPACFFQKHIGQGMHKAIHEKPIKGDKIIYVDSSEGIIGLIQYGVLEIHVWGSRIGTVEQPDWFIFDFDPDPGVKWARVARAAADMRDFLATLGLKSFLKTTGGKGLHVVVPIRPDLEWDEIKAFSRAIAEAYASRRPKDFTTNMSKKLRTGRMFIDYLRNGRGATAIAPYSTRARPGGLIATPISWEELEDGAKPADFTLETVVERVSKRFKDPWSQLSKTRQSITAKMLAAMKTK